MKKSIFTVILLCTVLLTSCSRSNSSDQALNGVTYETAVAEGGYPSDGAPAEYEASDASAPKSTDISASVQKKIIKNANVDIEAEDVTECYNEILNYAVSKGGYEYSQAMSKSTDYITLSATIKIPPEALDDVISFSRECGEIINTNISSTDITAEYTDAEIRLENKKKNLQKYYEYYEKAQTVEDALMLQKEIDSITAEIESYEGQIKMWNQLADESTLEFYIKQSNDPNKIKENVEWRSINFKTMGKIMRNGFTGVINVLIACVQWFLIFIVTISPILIIASIVLFIIRYIKKKNKALLQKDSPKEDSAK